MESFQKLLYSTGLRQENVSDCFPSSSDAFRLPMKRNTITTQRRRFLSSDILIDCSFSLSFLIKSTIMTAIVALFFPLVLP